MRWPFFASTPLVIKDNFVITSYPFELSCQQPKLFSEFERSVGSVPLRTDMEMHDVIQCLYMILLFINLKNLQISWPVDTFTDSALQRILLSA